MNFLVNPIFNINVHSRCGSDCTNQCGAQCSGLGRCFCLTK